MLDCFPLDWLCVLGVGLAMPLVNSRVTKRVSMPVSWELLPSTMKEALSLVHRVHNREVENKLIQYYNQLSLSINENADTSKIFVYPFISVSSYVSR